MLLNRPQKLSMMFGEIPMPTKKERFFTKLLTLLNKISNGFPTTNLSIMENPLKLVLTRTLPLLPTSIDTSLVKLTK